MSREYYRPYTKVLQIADNTTKHTVDFRDTGANLIRCNYITVTAASGVAEGIFSVVVSGLDLTVSAPHQSLATETAYAISYGIVTEANNRADNSLHGAYGGFNGVGT